MPNRCAVAGCGNHKKEGVSLHKFPTCEKTRKKWNAHMKLTHPKWTGQGKQCCICSDHFNDSDFEDEGLWSLFGMRKVKRLKPNAIPRINSNFKRRKAELEPLKKRREKSIEKRDERKMLAEMLKAHEEARASVKTATEAGPSCKCAAPNSCRSSNNEVCWCPDGFECDHSKNDICPGYSEPLAEERCHKEPMADICEKYLDPKKQEPESPTIKEKEEEAAHIKEEEEPETKEAKEDVATFPLTGVPLVSGEDQGECHIEENAGAEPPSSRSSQHLETESDGGSQADGLSAPLPEMQSPKSYMQKHDFCSVCGKGFRDRASCTNHTRTHTAEKPYACSVCSKSFAKRGALARHSRIHSGEKPHACSICPKRYTQKRDLMSHEMTHTGEKPYLCSVCGKGYRDRASFTYHTRTHTGEKPYVCSVCSKSFTKMGTLARHSRIHTGEKPHACSDCGKRFTDKGTLAHRGETFCMLILHTQ